MHSINGMHFNLQLITLALIVLVSIPQASSFWWPFGRKADGTERQKGLATDREPPTEELQGLSIGPKVQAEANVATGAKAAGSIKSGVVESKAAAEAAGQHEQREQRASRKPPEEHKGNPSLHDKPENTVQCKRAVENKTQANPPTTRRNSQARQSQVGPHCLLSRPLCLAATSCCHACEPCEPSVRLIQYSPHALPVASTLIPLLAPLPRARPQLPL